MAYLALIVLLRVSGKRTLSKWNSFDFVITVAFGSTLATALLSKEVTLSQGVAAFALLVALQFLITWLSVRVGFVRTWVKGHPTVLLINGRYQEDALRRCRVTRGEVLAALRSQGHASVLGAGAVVLETDGRFSVGSSIATGGNSTLKGVDGSGVA